MRFLKFYYAILVQLHSIPTEIEVNTSKTMTWNWIISLYKRIIHLNAAHKWHHHINQIYKKLEELSDLNNAGFNNNRDNLQDFTWSQEQTRNIFPRLVSISYCNKISATYICKSWFKYICYVRFDIYIITNIYLNYITSYWANKLTNKKEEMKDISEWWII
jgi:hypothetical protein